MDHYRPIKPAIVSSEGESPNAVVAEGPAEDKARRRHILRACNPCRARKSKCDGGRPTCELCRQRGFACVYEPLNRPKLQIQELENELRQCNSRLQEHESLIEKLWDGVRDLSGRLDQTGGSAAERKLVQQLLDLVQPVVSAQNAGTKRGHDPQTSAMDVDRPTIDGLPSSSKEQPQSTMQPGELSFPSTQVNKPVDAADESKENLPPTSAVDALSDWTQKHGFQAEIYGDSQEYLFQPRAEAGRDLQNKVYLTYRDEARKWIATGVPEDEVLGPDECLVDLIFRPRLPQDPHLASHWACEVIKTFGDLQLWYRLAASGFLTRLMKWLLKPSERSYALVPGLIRPTCSQRLVPHPAFFDLLPFPALRDGLIRSPQMYQATWQANIFCNWPHTLEEAIDVDPQNNRWTLKKVFEDFSADPRNWSVGKEIGQALPEVPASLGDRVQST